MYVCGRPPRDPWGIEWGGGMAAASVGESSPMFMDSHAWPSQWNVGGGTLSVLT